MAQYEAGQRWSYQTREQDAGSTLVIGKVQKDPQKPAIIHVVVEEVSRPGFDAPIVIGHMPFSEQAISDSVLELIETGAELSSDFADCIAVWEEEEGGVFAITVAEAVEAVVSTAPQPFDDPFDGIVIEMRAQQSDELIGELYRQLFSLDHWFFLCEPDNPRAPVQWEFPDGMNPQPAILAFTSSERAASAAAMLGVYPEGSKVSIMPAVVKEAVEWITGPNCDNEWLCFNLTQQNFPLYCEDAVGLLQQMQ